MPTRLYTIKLAVIDKNRMAGTVAAEDGKAGGAINAGGHAAGGSR